MHGNYNANNSALSTTLQQTHRHATLAHHAINHHSAAHWPIYICWGAVAEETYWKAHTNRGQRTLCLPLHPQSILSQQCHSARGQRPPFCLARGLKNQSHVQEIHPACLTNTERLIVCSGSGMAAHFWISGSE